MRKALATLFVALFAFTLFGCAEESNDYTGVSTATGPDREEIYLELLREEIPELRTVSDSMILDNAKAFCELFDAGGTFKDAYMVATDAGMSTHEGGVLIGGAIAYECPRHKNLLD